MARIVLEFRQPEKHFPRRWVAEARVGGKAIATAHDVEPLTAMTLLAVELAHQLETATKEN